MWWCDHSNVHKGMKLSLENSSEKHVPLIIGVEWKHGHDDFVAVHDFSLTKPALMLRLLVMAA